MEKRENPMKVVYRIDSERTITFVNQAWTDFALRNDAEHLLPQEVLGNCVWDYISCPETSYLYRALFDKVVKEGRTVQFPFRCDSPGARRYMEMTVAPGSKGSCKLTSVVLREELREPVALMGESAPRDDDEELLHMCSWCKKIGLPEERWVEIEDAVRALDLFAYKDIPRITHGMCPDCFGTMERTLEM